MPALKRLLSSVLNQATACLPTARPPQNEHLVTPNTPSTSHTDHQDTDTYMRSLFTEAVQAQRNNPSPPSFVPQIDHESTAVYRPFLDRRIVVGLVNMHGCSSVLVISHIGAWWSHFWEVPSFRTRSFDGKLQHSSWTSVHAAKDHHGVPIDFRENTLKFLSSNEEYVIQDPHYVFSGLGSYIGKGKPFAPGTDTRVVIFTPKTWPPIGELLQFPEHVNKIRKLLVEGLDGITTDVMTVSYNRRGRDKHADSTNDGGDPAMYANMNGKFLLKYDPRYREDLASVEVRAEDRSEPVARMEWPVADSGAKLDME